MMGFIKFAGPLFFAYLAGGLQHEQGYLVGVILFIPAVVMQLAWNAND